MPGREILVLPWQSILKGGPGSSSTVHKISIFAFENKTKTTSWMERRRIWLNTTALSYPSCGQLLTFSLGRGIILVACEVKLLSLSSQRHFPGLTCPGPGRRKQRPGLQKKRTVGCYLTTGGSFVYPFPEMLDRRISTQSRNKSRACLAARGFIV